MNECLGSLRERPARCAGLRVAAVFTLTLVGIASGGAGCGPRVNPRGPGDSPDERVSQPAPDAGAAPRPTFRPAREMLVGEMCPTPADGRPAVMPMFMRAVTWSDEDAEVSTPIESQRARQFSVLAWDGRRVGIFSVAGAAEVGLGRKAAVGAYAGSSPCTRPPAVGNKQSGDDAACVKSQDQCGLAISALQPLSGGTPYDEDPEPATFDIAGACMAGDQLHVDIDGDGVDEAYPVAAFLDPVRAPAEEVVAVPRNNAACKTHRFALRNVIPPLSPESWNGQKLQHWRGLDILGVVDIDGDKRRELVVSYHYSDRRTWALYSAQSTVGRLDLVGESVPWPR